MGWPRRDLRRHAVRRLPDGPALTRRWRSHPLGDLAWRAFGDEWVAFDGGSGLTFAMEPLHAAVMNCFEEAPQDLDSLRAKLRAEFDLDVADPALLQGIVDQFVVQGLIVAEGPIIAG